MVIYFVTVPKVNEEALVQLTVEAGNEELLEDIYFSGYLYDYGTFYVNDKEGVTTNESLSYLEKLDALGDPSLDILQEKYPEMISELNYNNRISHFYILNSKEELVTGHFKISNSNYYIDSSTVYLSTLNKETNEIIEDTVKRENYPDGDHINIVGMYEEYPVVKILYSVSTWNVDHSGEKSSLTVGEYNFETKDYSENSLLNEDGSLYEYASTAYNAKNNEMQIIHHYGNDTYENTNTPSEPSAYVYNFVEDTLSPLETTTANYFIGNNNELYTLENEGEDIFLRQYDQTEQEIENEVALETEFPLHLYSEYPLLTEVIDDQLFVVQSAADEMSGQGALPTDFQVFDMHSGENLLTGKIAYNTDSEVNITEATILSLFQKSDF